MKVKQNAVKSLLFGVALGDALGVPVEFKSRNYLKDHPVKVMTGYGTHNQPPGTFSDDSSLTFCLAEALTGDFNLHTIARNFILWKNEGFWSAHGKVFDIGSTTSNAIHHLEQGIEPEFAGENDLQSNGNGSLMRIAPLLFYIHDKPQDERFRITQQVSSITHGHLRSVIACFYYLEYAGSKLNGLNHFESYKRMQNEFPAFLDTIQIPKEDRVEFDRLLMTDISKCPEEEIYSGGYVIHTLEAAIWCLLNTGSYEQAVLKAVNLGKDTDTTGAVTGGLAGLYYGFENFPQSWIDTLARKDDIANLAERLSKKMSSII
jgi:ADP-ribosyl-[dinitrogen reductase] hydrolase